MITKKVLNYKASRLKTILLPNYLGRSEVTSLVKHVILHSRKSYTFSTEKRKDDKEY